MAIDFSKPALTDNYTSAFVPNLQANQTALARMLDSGVESITGTIPTNAKRYNRSSSAFEEWNGSAWVMLPLQGIYYSGGNVGINAPTPTNQLHMRHATNPVMRFESVAGDSGYLDYTTARMLVSAGGGYISMVAANAEQGRLTSTGLGLGVAPSYKLDVLASASSVANFKSAGASAILRVADGTGDTGYIGSGGSLLAGLARTDFGITANSGGALVLGSSNIARVRIDSTGDVTPGVDNGYRMGSAALRWNEVHALAFKDGTNGTFLTSTGTVAQVTPGSTWTAAVFYTGGAERMRLTSNLGVNGTADASVRLHVNPGGGNGAGLHVGDVSTGITLYHSAASDPAIIFGSASVLRLATQTGYGAAGFVERAALNSSGHFYPGADNTQTLGLTSRHWSTVYGMALQRDTAGDLTINAANAGGAVKVRVAGSEYLHLSADGRFSGTALHNNAAGLAGTTRQFVGSLRGTTLTTSNLFNLSAASCSAHHGVRVGNQVYCTALFNVTASAAGEAQFFFTPPIATNTTTTNDAPGVATADFNSTTKVAGVVKGGGGSNTFSVTWNSPAAGSYSVYVSFMYEVK